jgi:hypothetical protein
MPAASRYATYGSPGTAHRTEGEPDRIGTILAGETETRYREPPANSVYGTLAADVTFRDLGGVTWRRSAADGSLSEEPSSGEGAAPS